MRLAVWLLRRKYFVSEGDAAQEAYRTALHELRHQVQELRRERDHWKLRASIHKIKGC